MKKMTKSALMTALITGSLMVVATGAFAEEVQEFALDDIVVTASRVETKKVDTPANVAVITKEDLADHNYASASDALRAMPGVNILGSGAKGSSMGQDVIMINGDERVLVLIDGRRANIGSSGNSSADWLPPVNAIERIEVLKGGGSALYGTDAVGGVVNVILKKGSDLGNHVTVKAAGGSFNSEQYSLTATGSTDSGLGVMVAASKERRGNYKYKGVDGKTHKLDNSRYDDKSVIVKIDQKIGDDQRLTAQFEHINAEGGSPFGSYGFGNTDDHKRVNNNVALRYDWNEASENAGYVNVYRNHHHAQFLSPSIYSQSDFTDITTGFEAQQNFKLAENDSLTAGLEYYKTSVDNTGLYAGKRDINNKALFLENRWEFAPTWQLNTGLRFDDHSKYGNQFTPKVAVNKKFNEDSNVYLSWGKVFNAPTTDDLYWNQMGMYGNPDLDAEKGDVWTLGTNTKLGAKTNLSASIFYSKIKDAIAWGAVDPTYTTSYDWSAFNLNKERRQGLEISVDHEFNDRLSGYASYTYVQVKQDTGRGYTRDLNSKPNIYRAGLKYKAEDWLFTLDTTTVSGQNESRYVDSSYFTLDLGAQYAINDHAKLFVNGYNLTNARYAEYGRLYGSGEARYPMPSRSFIIGAEYTF